MKKPKITYYYDALCGWCYGFSPVVEHIHDKYKDFISFNIVNGGLFVGDRVGLVNDVAPYIKQGAYKTVEAKTGVKFGDEFINQALGNNSMLLDSLPPSIALCIVKKSRPDLVMDYASALLNAFYHDGMSADELEKYELIAKGLGMKTNDFLAKMKQDIYIKAAWEEFAFCISNHIGGYPCLTLQTEQETITLSSGYSSFETIDAAISKVVDHSLTT